MSGPADNPFDFLASLTEAELGAFRASAQSQSFGAGEVLFHEGDEPGGIVAIISGRVRVSARGASGDEVVLRLSGGGEIVGEIAAITGRPRSATVTVLDQIEALLMARAEFNRFLGEHPRVAALVAEHIKAILGEAKVS